MKSMNMLKRIIPVLITSILVMPAVIAYADVISVDNGFFHKHESEMTYSGRYYVVDAEDGSTSVMDEPGKGRGIVPLNNGQLIWIYKTYLYEGELWGYATWYHGFIKLDQLLELYDHVAFAEEHADEFYPYHFGNYLEIERTNTAIGWPWPGAGDFLFKFEEADMKKLKVQYVYRDADGREWGFVEELGAIMSFWVCLTDPLNEDIPVFHPSPDPYDWISFHKKIEIAVFVSTIPENNAAALFVTSALVIVLIAGTAVLIRRFWKPNKAKLEG